MRAVWFRDGAGRSCVLLDRFDLEAIDAARFEPLSAVLALEAVAQGLPDVEPDRLRRLFGAPPAFWGADEDGLYARVSEELRRDGAGRLCVLGERRRMLVSALPPPEPPAAPAPAPVAPAKPPPAPAPAPPPPKPAPAPERKIEGKFDREKAKCGDEVFLLASSKNIPDGEAVTFSLTTDAGKAVDSAKDKLASSSAKTKWIAKGAPDQKTTFKVAAGGVSGDAPKPLVIHKYADVASDTKTIACTSGVYGWTGKFDIKLAAGVVHVTTKVKLLNRQGARPASGAALPAVGAAVSAADKASMKADIEGKLSGKWLFHRDACQRKGKCDCDKGRACCMFKSEIHVEFVEAGQHHDVNLFQGNARADSGNWTRVKTRPNSWAHETGHLLGFYDEYTGGAVGTAPRWKPNEVSHVMNTGLTVPETYYWDFRDWLKAKLGESWALLGP